MVRTSLLVFTLLAAANLSAQVSPPKAPAQKSDPSPVAAPPTVGTLQKTVEAYLRKIYAWGPAFRVKIGDPADAPVPGFYKVPVEVTMGEQSDSTFVYVSKDGRYLFRGEIQDMIADPLAAVRSQIHLDDSPSKGPASARVVVVEYADFQCPTCRQLHNVLREIEPQYPQIRVVFKDFPLAQIHPWAMTAALAGRCAYLQNPQAFWKMYDSIFDGQEVISAENAYDKMLAFAAQAGLDIDAFRVCMAGPEAQEAITKSVKEAQVLKIVNTPTVFVNGRRMIGADRELLEQYIRYELGMSPHSPAKSR